ncbi:cupredoxin family copper-binding protein [Nostoc sp. NMS4]|uniref:cupredoxin domain-containing protein n=1 Tax=Nostoc sp. NMS4 TaxID=2815390 RepID=UPI0025F4FC2C|nr:cupredoxin family copper-binding protein [Nostoc sp. NMS4]MBN3921731.1 cupredoxin family copper-binding protein [Nostoc sp. NMS4]
MKYISYFLQGLASAILVIVFSLSSCTPNRQSVIPTPQAQEINTNTANPTVKIVNFKYLPSDIKIGAGDTVQFVNQDEEPHTVTAKDGSFDSKGLDNAEAWKHTFTQPGTFPYLCSIHPYMQGTITVSTSKKHS